VDSSIETDFLPLGPTPGLLTGYDADDADDGRCDTTYENQVCALPRGPAAMWGYSTINTDFPSHG
jgi:hypothetical protein